jgi:hypothetical protein
MAVLAIFTVSFLCCVLYDVVFLLVEGIVAIPSLCRDRVTMGVRAAQK